MHSEHKRLGRLGMVRRRLGLVGIVGVVVAIGIATATSGAAPRYAARTASGQSVTNYVTYVAGKAGKANPKLAPVEIGFSNNQGGTVIQAGAVPTAAAQLAVNWVNKYADGIHGHPLKLVTCFVKNVEAEGTNCGQQFVNNPAIKVVDFGALAVGAKSIHSVIAGKLPVIEPLALEPTDASRPHTYILDTSAPFVVYGWGPFGSQYLKGKSMAIVYPNQPGISDVAADVKASAIASGMTATLVGFDPATDDLIGALTAAGAQNADVVAPIVGAPDECLATAKAMAQLGIPQTKAVGFFNCAVPSLKAQYPGQDYPKWYYGIASSGDGYLNTPAGDAFRKVLTEFGLGTSRATDPWTPTVFSAVLTTARFLNEAGAAHGISGLTPAAISAEAKAFKGPAVLGPPIIHCGNYPSYPGLCSDGDYFFRYDGNDMFTRIPHWFPPPVSLQKANHAKVITH